jgi:dipeptidyl aminopeptidase/acylaminoacyl peptidase
VDKRIYFKVYDRDYEHIYRYDGKANNFEMLPLSVDLAQQVDYSGNGLFAVYRGMSASYPSKAYVLNLTTKESTLISDPEKEKMDQIILGEVQDHNFKSKDGTTIYGRYYLPSDFDKNLKYPMIVYYYGGTTPVQRTFSSNWNFHFWASMGYVVYVVQPSGTIGFGQEFSARHVNAWGEMTADDIIQGVNSFCAAHSFVNTKNIGCIGASYGGYMTMYLQTKTNLFATAISHAGISALSSYWGNGYWGYEYSAVATADTYPWNNSKFYTDHSPLFHAEKINTPLLLIQGEVDTNVPTGESMQMFTALKILGKPVSMIRVKDEDHIITEYQHKIDWNYSIMAWMAKYLQDDSAWWENLYPESKK